MNLRIENPHLLKPYTAPYNRKRGAHHKPDGWTPERTPEMHAAFDALKIQHPTTPEYMIWEQVEADEAKRMTTRQMPWPGWVPVDYKRDKDIGNAYRELYVRMNGEHADLLARGVPLDGRKAELPPDGDYVFENGEIKAVRYCNVCEMDRSNWGMDDDRCDACCWDAIDTEVAVG